MENYDKIYKNKQLQPLAYADIDGSSDYNYYCLSDPFVGYVRQFLQRMADNPYWFYSSALEGGRYRTPDQSTFDKISAIVGEGVNELMSGDCLEGVIEAIDRQTQAMIATQCCPETMGSGSAGQYEAAPVGWTDNGNNQNPDFESRDEYDIYKCGVAKLLHGVIKQDLLLIQNTDASAIAAAVLVITLATPIPFDEVVGLASYIATLVAEAVLDTVLQNVIDAWDSSEDDLICFFYEGQNEQSIIDALQEWIGQKVGVLEGTFLGYFFSVDHFNRLFEHVAGYLPAHDCSGCGEGEPCGKVYVANGILVSTGLQTAIIRSKTAQGRQKINIKFNANLNVYCGSPVRITAVSFSQNPLKVSEPTYRIFNQAGTAIYSSDVPFVAPIDNAGWIAIVGGDIPEGNIYDMQVWFEDM